MSRGRLFCAIPADFLFPNRSLHNNQIQFDYRNGFMFMQGGGNPVPPGSLAIMALSGVPMYRACLGIGMSNATALAVPAWPNTTMVFTPRPQYWITAGTFARGQILDRGGIASQAQVPFDGTFAMQAVLGRNNLWTISRG